MTNTPDLKETLLMFENGRILKCANPCNRDMKSYGMCTCDSVGAARERDGAGVSLSLANPPKKTFGFAPVPLEKLKKMKWDDHRRMWVEP